MDIKKINIDQLKLSNYNPRKDLNSNDKEYKDIENSIKKFGYIEPIVINKNFNIIGGHQRYKVLKDLNYDLIDCVIVDLNQDDEKTLNIALNKIDGKWDLEKLVKMLDEMKAKDFDSFFLTGFDEFEFQELEEQLNELGNTSNNNSSSSNDENDNEDHENDNNDNDGRYSREIKAPNYISKLENQPKLKELYSVDKVNELIQKINNIDENNDYDIELKLFLKFAAYRFTKFDYEMIAEYYSHANKKIQEIFEDLALVIIDFNKSIEKGFVEFNKNVLDRIEENEMNKEHENEG